MSDKRKPICLNTDEWNRISRRLTKTVEALKGTNNSIGGLLMIMMADEGFLRLTTRYSRMYDYEPGADERKHYVEQGDGGPVEGAPDGTCTDGVPTEQASGQYTGKHDTDDGPCSCGVWHFKPFNHNE